MTTDIFKKIPSTSFQECTFIDVRLLVELLLDLWCSM